MEKKLEIKREVRVEKSSTKLLCLIFKISDFDISKKNGDKIQNMEELKTKHMLELLTKHMQNF